VKALDLWDPPSGAGRPIGCVATSFTFDADFFSRDCLSRFLGLTAALGEGDHVTDLSLVIEEEERLGEASVVVLVDRSAGAVPRNLRWDLLPVSIPNALLHAKAAVLVWEHTVRIIVGSANLTRAGYRRQVELVCGFEFSSERSDTPRAIADQLLDEVERIIDEAAAAYSGATSRARATISAARTRVAEFARVAPVKGVKLAVAPVRPGRTALEAFAEVWSGSAPRRCRAASPFWDGTPGGPADNGVAAIAGVLSERRHRGARPVLELVADRTLVDGRFVVRAPATITDSVPGHVEASVLAFAADGEGRRLHAKCVQFDDGRTIATMFGSSNLTAKGLGLHASSHRELNLWICAGLTTPTGKWLRKLIDDDGPVEPGEELVPEPDEDELAAVTVPTGFVAAVLTGAGAATELHLELDADHLPSDWSVRAPGVQEHPILAAADLTPPLTGQITHVVAIGDVAVLPSVLEVTWLVDGSERTAAWMVVVDDPAALPPPAALRDLPVDLVLRVLASTRPLRAELEDQIREQERLAAQATEDVLDPLRRHVLTTALLPRVRAHSRALTGIRKRLEQPISSNDALQWRLHGALGPAWLARRIADESSTGAQWLPGEAAFLLSELALTICRVEWDVRPPVTNARLDAAVGQLLDEIEACIAAAGGGGSVPQLQRYIDVALGEVRR
jgi:hypothetical protein